MHWECKAGTAADKIQPNMNEWVNVIAHIQSTIKISCVHMFLALVSPWQCWCYWATDDRNTEVSKQKYCWEPGRPLLPAGVCMYRAWKPSPDGISNGALKETRLSVTLITQPEHRQFHPTLTSAGGARRSACLYVELPSSHCFSAFHKVRSNYSYRFQIASVWTTRNPIMSFI